MVLVSCYGVKIHLIWHFSLGLIFKHSKSFANSIDGNRTGGLDDFSSVFQRQNSTQSSH